ncbi:hypothetical protein NO559_03255 [Dasania sp. GY-MA-18]|uniref:Motility protein n=1 Tax=Dasania phycosphaerae TaxID=2950436 RepID=A0A9J6RIM2_9GAMM|nr:MULTISPECIES: hypothetical protein [Dasania]MCR8921773.1 hypothetical protein [Dasania sp. GY-MA-18]MCZ0864201.1 hypothetical protein [Dasania phycosphaerae]MCZ0867929.1 hypothetical protein [Dasania phycosphaerae]
MEIGSSTSSQLVTNSQELVGAKLAKKQQVAEGEAALKLLESASIDSPAATGNLGAHINIKA